MSTKARLGVLVSGSGSNLQALIDACQAPEYPAEIAVVISNVPTAYALERARAAGLTTATLEHRSFASRDAFDSALAEALHKHQVQWVCLAGFMRVLGAGFLRQFPMRVLNIHPALLPSFPGMHAVRQAIQYGVKISGCTVHFVDEGTDTGPIIAQVPVPVLPEDTEQTLAARILEQEHRCYAAAVRMVVAGGCVVDGRMVRVSNERLGISQA